MNPLVIPDPTMYLKTKFVAPRKGTGLPEYLRLSPQNNSGSNNAFCRAHSSKHLGHDIGVRRPLKKSDTRKMSSASEEAKLTLIAAYVNASPKVFDIWYCARGTREQNKGLHVVMERFPNDMHDIIFRDLEFLERHRGDIARELDKCAIALSKVGMITYDIKSSNIVVRKDPLDVKFIDYGNDYCEMYDMSAIDLQGKRAHGGENPVLSELVAQCRRFKNSKKIFESVVRISILVCLSANISNEIHKRRREYNLGQDLRRRMNPLHDYMKHLRQGTPAAIVRLVKVVLRSDNVRECNEHYNGNRNSCVKRMFRHANFMRDETRSETRSGEP